MRILLNLGRVIATQRIDKAGDNDYDFCMWIAKCRNRFIKCDWGDVDDEVRTTNEKLISGKKTDGRLMARYNNPKGDIYIITTRDPDFDENRTIIKFVDEEDNRQ